VKFNSSDNDFIEASLDGMSYCHNCTKRQFQTSNLLKVDSKLELFIYIYILQVVMFQNVLMDPKILKEKQISLFFFNVLWNLCVFLVSYTCLHVI
jgi:hypothetical protein